MLKRLFSKIAVRLPVVRRSRLGIQMASGSANTVVAILSQLLLAPIYLRELGPELFGLWSAFSVVTMLGQLGNAGVSDSLIRHVALSHAKNRLQECVSFSVTALFMMMLIGSSFLAAVVVIRVPLLGLLKIPGPMLELGEILVVGVGVLTFLLLIQSVVRATLIGIGRMESANYLNIIGIVIQTCVAIILIFMDAGVWAIFFGILAYYVWSISSGIVMAQKIAGIAFWRFSMLSRAKAGEIFSMGYKLVLARVLGLGIEPLAIITISRYVGLVEVAYFSIAYRMILRIREVFAAGLLALLPMASALETRGNTGARSTADLNNKITAWLGIIVAPVFLILFFAANFFFHLWLGKQYSPNIAHYFSLLLMPYFLNILSVPFYNTLVGWGRTDKVLVVFLVTTVTFVAGLLINWQMHFSPGTTGIVLALAIAVAIGAVMTFYCYRFLLRERLT